MHEMAEAGDWVAVVGLEAERRGLIGGCFAQQSPFRDTELAARRIGQILDLDRRLLEISTAQKSEVGTALNKLKQGRTAINAYEECTR
jgi:hypothetical protein